MLEVGGSIPSPPTNSFLPAHRELLPLVGQEGRRGGWAKAQLPKLPVRDVEILSRDEVAKMENTARNERDKLIIRVLADTGVRVAELCGLRTADLLDRDRRWYLRVRGKRGQRSPRPGP